MKIYYWRVYRVGRDPLIPTCVKSNHHYTGCPQGRPCLGLGRVSFLHGMPAGQAVSRFGSGIISFFFFFFFVVVTNLHINLFIKLSPLLEGMYCSDCLQQTRPNENLLLARISRGTRPPHPYLCEVKSSLHGMPAGQAVSRFGSGIFFTRDARRAGRV